MHGLFERAELERGPQLQTDGAIALGEVVVDVHRVLPVQHQEALLDDRAVHLVAPQGQALFEPELREVVRAGHLQHAARALLPADLEARTIGQTHPLGDVVEHDGAPERRRQGRDEQPVVAARRHAGDRA